MHGWEIEQLGEVCDVVGGGTPPKDNAKFYDGNILWATVRDMKSEIITETEHRITRQALVASSAKIVPAGNVVIATRVGLGKVCLVAQDTAINQDLRGIIPNDPNRLSVRFLFYWLKSIAHLIVAEGTGATVQGVKLPFVKSLSIPLPSLKKQQRIVGILDKAFDGIAIAKVNAERNLQNAQDLFDSCCRACFDVGGSERETRPLGDVCDLLNGFAFKSEDAVSKSNTQLVRMGNLYGNKLELGRKPVFYPDKFAKQYSRYRLEEGDIILSLTGTVGKEDYGYAVRIPEVNHNLLLNQRIAKFESIKENLVRPGYLLHYLRSRTFLSALYPTSNGTRQANLSSVTIKTLSIPLPSLKEQELIIAKLDGLAETCLNLKSIWEQKSTLLNSLKSSLLHQAFTGAL